MGVSFYVCRRCERTYPDCGPRADCNEDWGGCGAGYCSEACARLERPGYERVPTWKEVNAMYENSRAEWEALKVTCFDCRGENANDSNLLDYALTKLSMHKDALAREYLDEQKRKRLGS